MKMPGTRLPAGLALVCLLSGSLAFAQTQTNVAVPGRGNGTYGVSLQHITITKRDLNVVTEEFGEVTLRAAYFDFDYGLTDRLAVNVTLPFKSNRFVGDRIKSHDPSILANDHGEAFLDDGRYHSAWGDLGINLRWLWRTQPIAVTPFVGFYTPSNDYPLFTETQAGTAQWRTDFGVNLAGRLGPPRLNLSWQAGLSYSYKEKTRPSDAAARRVNSSRVSVEFLWRATPLITPYLSISHVEPHNALELFDFNDFPFTTLPFSDQYYYHDQLLPWGYTTWSLGAAWQAPGRLSLSASYGQTLHAKFGHFFEPAIALNIFRGFSLND